MLRQRNHDASQGNSDDDDDDENDGQQCNPGRYQVSIVSAGANLDDVDGDRSRNAIHPSPHHHHYASESEYFNFNHLSRSSKKRRTSISSNDAVFMTLSPSSPSHYFSSHSEAENSNSSSPIIPLSNRHHHCSNSRPHQSPSVTTESSFASAPPSSGPNASSPNAKTPRSDGGGGDIGFDYESHRNNIARETLQDKIDDNSYAASAWWFLSSNSDSFGNIPDKKSRQQPPQYGNGRMQYGSISTNTTM